MRILLYRGDHIGDVILSLPMAKLLKQHYKDCEIYYLSKGYTKDVVGACPQVNDFIDWGEILAQPQANGIKQLQAYQFDAFINVYADRTPAQYAAKAKIPLRIGTSRRWFHWLYCNRRVKLSRVKSSLHEAQLNLKLLAPLGIAADYPLQQIIPELSVTTQLPAHLQNYIDPQRFNLIIHPGSHGNGREWPASYYLQLIQSLPQQQFNIIVTGSANEEKLFSDSLLKPLNTQNNVHNGMGKMSLQELIILIAHAQGLIASGTGPLHCAAALGIHTLGFYPNHPIIGPTRWQPLGIHANYFMATIPCSDGCKTQRSCACMQTITVDNVIEYLLALEKKPSPQAATCHLE